MERTINTNITEKTLNHKSHIPTREEFHKTDSGILCKSDFEPGYAFYMSQMAERITMSRKKDYQNRNKTKGRN